MAIKYNSNTSSEDDVIRKEMTHWKQNMNGNKIFINEANEKHREDTEEKYPPCSEIIVHHSDEDKDTHFHMDKTVSCQDEKCKISETNKQKSDTDTDELKRQESARTGVVKFFIIFYILKTFLDCLNFSSRKIYNVRKHSASSSDSSSRTKWKDDDMTTNYKLLSKKLFEFFFFRSEDSLKEVCVENSKCVPCLSPYKIWSTIPATTLTLYPVYDLHHYCQTVEGNPDISSEEQMKYEIVRYSSFRSFPVESPVLPMNLAKAGFYSTGNTDEVTCFSCKLKYKNWKAKDIPLEIHAKLSPTCEFIKTHTNNIPLSSTNNLLSGACGNNSDLLRTHTEENRERLPENAHRESTRRSNETLEIERQSNGNDALQNTTAGSIAISNAMPTQSQAGNMTIPQSEVNSSNTPQSGSVNSTQQHLEENNITIPQSQMVSFGRPQSEMNNALSQSPAVTSTPPWSQASNSAQASSRAHSVLVPLGINFQRPKYQKYAVMATRLSSFRNWPKSSRQNPETMAKAGFIYEGLSDNTKCFFCGGGLREWEPNDDPWIEHARWYPDCVYVQQCKGTKFIEEVQKGNIPEQQVQTPAKSFETELQSHPAVLSVMDMGYSEALIKRAVKKFCMKKDISDLKAEQLMDIVWDLEDTASDLNTNEEVVEKDTDPEIAKEETKSADKESVERLLAENHQLKDNQTCKICMDEDTSIVFLPCGHMVTCGNCAPAVRRCPICRTFIKGTVKAILS